MINRPRITLLLLLAGFSAVHAQAQLAIQSSITASLGLYRYTYDVSNQTATDVSVITLGGFFPAADAVHNLTAPSDYLAFFDPGVGLLSFVEGSQPFLSGSLAGSFTFDSPYAPAVGAFEAIDVNGAILVGQVQVPASPVPEPSTYAAAAALVLGAMIFRRYRSSKLNPATL
jgi:hypothetical protein